MPFVCPVCKGPLTEDGGAYSCAADARAYRIIDGIADFRLFPDPHIDIPAEDAKVARMADEATRCSFADLLAFYYSLPPVLPRDLVEKYLRYNLSGAARGRRLLNSIGGHPADSTGSLLDLGSGSGGVIEAAQGTFTPIVGLDIGLRWLLTTRKRLEERGGGATLVCGCAEHLPFPACSFQTIVASDVLEHTAGQLELLREAHRVLRPGGRLVLTTPNRWVLGPDPHVRLPGVGFLPKRWRARYVRLLRGVGYGQLGTLNCFELQRLLRQSGFTRWRLVLPDFPDEQLAGLSGWERLGARLYRPLKQIRAARGMLLLFGPVLQVVCTKQMTE